MTKPLCSGKKDARQLAKPLAPRQRFSSFEIRDLHDDPNRLR
jgi:hypothetical protein